MRRKLHILVSLAVVLAALFVAQLLRGGNRYRDSQLKGLYDRYSCQPGVRAALICDYPVADTVAVDMLMLTATDDSAWDALIHDFGMTPPPPEVTCLTGDDFTEIRSAPKYDYSLPRDPVPGNNDEVSIAWGRHQICVFHITDTAQVIAIRYYNYTEMTKSTLVL